MEQIIPNFIKPYLWSYDISKLDMQTNKRRIITNILNVGSAQATDWLFSVYSKEEIIDVIVKPLSGEWNKRSLHFWSLILGVVPGSLERGIRHNFA